METTKNDRIKRVIEYKNITQVDLANILGVKKQLVKNWVSNAQPVPDKYIKYIMSITGHRTEAQCLKYIKSGIDEIYDKVAELDFSKKDELDY